MTSVVKLREMIDRMVYRRQFIDSSSHRHPSIPNLLSFDHTSWHFVAVLVVQRALAVLIHLFASLAEQMETPRTNLLPEGIDMVEFRELETFVVNNC